MKLVHICVPVLTRYDLLKRLLESLHGSSYSVSEVHIINNGRDRERLTAALSASPAPVDILTPLEPGGLGLAESWNWFIDNVPEERIITNDDITFSQDSVKTMVEAEGPVVSALLGTNAFSCFLIRDFCVKKVGKFDERISPGYAYFEDCDYGHRLELLNMQITGVDAGVVHDGSQTVKSFGEGELRKRHHEKFLIAQTNYIRKWGGLPHGKELQK